MYNNIVQVKERPMSLRTTYSQARANLAELLDRVSQDRETVVIERRRGKGRVAMIAEDELDSILETAHQRLLSALRAALAGEGARLTMNELRAEAGLEPKEP
jgi:antitoxin YefM